MVWLYLASREIFDKMADKDVISWNTMIIGYAINRQGKAAMEMFNDMKRNDYRIYFNYPHPQQRVGIPLVTKES
jgi:pentatricopeptide repeat protein